MTIINKVKVGDSMIPDWRRFRRMEEYPVSRDVRTTAEQTLCTTGCTAISTKPRTEIQGKKS